jgi:hypothetical protein
VPEAGGKPAVPKPSWRLKINPNGIFSSENMLNYFFFFIWFLTNIGQVIKLYVLIQIKVFIRELP